VSGRVKDKDENMVRASRQVERVGGLAEAAGSDGAELRRASEAERALYAELRRTYERIYDLMRTPAHAEISSEVERSETLLANARRLAAVVEPARRLAADAGLAHGIGEIWAETAASLGEILRLREMVLGALRSAMDETRRSLVRVGLGRSALAGYRAATGSSGARVYGRRA
jgi:hypothetical protein